MSLRSIACRGGHAWFGPKHGGRGFTPRSWAGWLCAGVYAAACAAAATELQGAGQALPRGLAVGLSTLLFVLVIFCTWSARPPR